MTIYQQNLQLLTVDIYKTKVNQNPEYMKDKFVTNVFYCLKSSNDLLQPNVRTTCVGTRTTPFIGDTHWQLLPIIPKLFGCFEKPNNIRGRAEMQL